MLRSLLSDQIDLAGILARLIALTIAITVHEFSHAKRAELAGDRTPRALGRVTLNPLAHYDLIGSTMILLFGFGWAKPVPINPLAFRHPRRDTIMVSLWGPLSNFIIAALLAIPVRLNVVGDYWMPIREIILINIMLGIFNLIPIPPLDGSHILEMMLPLRAHQRFEAFFARNRQWVLIAFLLIMFVPTLSRIVFGAISIPMFLLFMLLTGRLPY